MEFKTIIPEKLQFLPIFKCSGKMVIGTYKITYRETKKQQNQIFKKERLSVSEKFVSSQNV